MRRKIQKNVRLIFANLMQISRISKRFFYYLNKTDDKLHGCFEMI